MKNAIRFILFTIALSVCSLPGAYAVPTPEPTLTPGKSLKMTGLNGNEFFVSDVITGVTGNAYPAIANCFWTTAYKAKEKTVFIFNTGSTDILTYKIVGYPTNAVGNIPIALSNVAGVAQTDIDIAPNSYVHIDIDSAIYQVHVFLKSKVADSETHFSCMVTGRK